MIQTFLLFEDKNEIFVDHLLAAATKVTNLGATNHHRQNKRPLFTDLTMKRQEGQKDSNETSLKTDPGETWFDHRKQFSEDSKQLFWFFDIFFQSSAASSKEGTALT